MQHSFVFTADDKRVFGLVIDFGTSQSPKSTRPLTTYLCPSRPGHQALRNNFASSLLLRTCLPMTGRRVRRPTLFSLWRKARRENSAASRLLGTTSLRFALHGWQRQKPSQPASSATPVANGRPEPPLLATAPLRAPPTKKNSGGMWCVPFRGRLSGSTRVPCRGDASGWISHSPKSASP